MKASLTNYRQSPRKVRIVADAIRGKSVAQAKVVLHQVIKRSALPLEKLLDSATANASHNFKVSADQLFVKSVTVDKGPTLKRYRARAFGRGARINKRTSQVNLELGIKE